MNFIINKEPYNHQNYPANGKHILAHTSKEMIVVYQAFRESTARYAVSHQQFGGNDYSFNRMSWIKPNFLWMMYRSGWAQKEGQERILALWLNKNFFNHILNESVNSTFDPLLYENQEHWKETLEKREVRLQWDPDHDPYGNPLERRAIQLGLKGKILRQFACEEIKHIEDVTAFVTEQFAFVKAKQLDHLAVPVERTYRPDEINIQNKIQID
jgi:hypothetical protein